MKNPQFFKIPALVMLLVLSASCEKAPTIGEIQAVVDGYQVTFSADIRNADTWLWDFGDTKTSSEAAPLHKYEQSGTYTVTLTATGGGGESKATTPVIIMPSVTELLSGGPAAAGGKTWVLSPGYTAGMDGGGAIDNSMMVILPALENILTEIGLGDEYDNEYTFYADGRYKADVRNGIALISSTYGMFTGTIVNYGNESNNLGIYGASYTAPASATWTLHEEDLIIDAITNPLGVEVPAPHANVTITGKKWISISGDAFFGVLDYPTTRKFIIKEITPDKMYVALLICGYVADENAWSIPEYLFHLTFIPKK